MADELQYEIASTEQFVDAWHWARDLLTLGLAGGPMALFVGRPRRSLDQNNKLWPMLRDISQQVQWHGSKLTPENWKDIFTAALKRQKLVPGIDGGLVVIGGHTSKLSRHEFSELIELMYSFGTEHEVEWSEPSQETIRAEHKAASDRASEALTQRAFE